MTTNFDLAPPPKSVDGLDAVPIDIQTIDAHFVFDGAAGTATADATIEYIVGPNPGYPIFDLRQTMTAAWLDGVPLAVDALAHHAFGSGAFTDLRVIETMHAAGSTHTLRVQYPLALPDAQLGGSYLPALDWSSGPRLRFVFGLSDLNRARYIEAWLPANLIFDQFAIKLDVKIVNTDVAHSVITNASTTLLSPNHWQLDFPPRFTALSPLLEVRASDTLERVDGSMVLPVSGQSVALEGWKPKGSPVDLPAALDSLKIDLSDNEQDYGPYEHGARYVAFLNGGGMEYEGGTTSSTDALRHEVFHSWFARGIKPAGQADGWWDEAFATFHDQGADDSEPFSFTDPPILLCSRDPWQRHTPINSYDDGARFWRGLSALLGVGQVNALMKQLYESQRGNPVSTAMIEEFLLAKSGVAQVVDAFHRFVYGLSDPSPVPDLWLRDAVGDPGGDDWSGAFWDSPDLWIRNTDDDGTAHQAPIHGQDNWFHARVRNMPGSGTAEHLVVSFHARGFAGTEFRYPADFLPSIAARADFALAPGAARIVKARWPSELVPPAGSHTCLLASVIARSDQPGGNRHVWEDKKLAQKNLTIVELQPEMFVIVPVVISNWSGKFGDRFDLELVRDRRSASVEAALVHRRRDQFRGSGARTARFTPLSGRPKKTGAKVDHLDCGGHISGAARLDRGQMMTSARPELIEARYPESWQTTFDPGAVEILPLELKPADQTVVGLKLTAPANAKPGETFMVHFVQRSRATRQIVGGIAVRIDVRPRKGRDRVAS